jgi:hypothetical protein
MNYLQNKLISANNLSKINAHFARISDLEKGVGLVQRFVRESKEKEWNLFSHKEWASFFKEQD